MSGLIHKIKRSKKLLRLNRLESFMNCEQVSTEIQKWISRYASTNNFRLVIGVSGGIDSALVSTLCAMTGIETHVVTIPIHQKPDQVERAHNHIAWLKSRFQNISHHDIDLTSTFEDFKSKFSGPGLNQLGLANSKSRLRMVTLYQIAASFGGIVVGTGNKVEDFGVGFFTKYGDGGVDISPIADLTKTQVRALATHLGIIQDIIEAHPTDGLWEDNRTDEDQIGATYEELEWAMDYVDNSRSLDIDPRQGAVIEIFKGFREKNHHKMIPIPICVVSKN